MAYERKPFEYIVDKDISILGENSKYMQKLSIVSWNGYEPKYDLRRWRKDGEDLAVGKGITFTPEEMENLKTALSKIDNFSDYIDDIDD